MSHKIRIHSFADVDRGGKVRWTACELGYGIEDITLAFGDHLKPPYSKLNPYGQVPAAEVDGKVMIESTAICIALAERHPESGLIPMDEDEREAFWQHVCLLTTTLETPVVQYFLAGRGIADERWAALVGDSLRARLQTFAERLPERACLCGTFSIADIFAAYVLRIAVQAQLLPWEGKLAAYLTRLRERPAAIASRVFDSLET